MTTPDQAVETVAERVRTTAHTFLFALQGRLAHGRDRHLPALLSRNTPPDDAGLWLALELTELHPRSGPDPDHVTYTRAATAVTAAAQLWARTDVPHRPVTAERPTHLGAVLARVLAAGRGDDRDVARLLRAHALDEALPHLRPLVSHARKDGLALDYGLLARDLYLWQTPGGPHRVGQRWAQSLTRAKAHAARTARTASTATDR
ncbi:type I-E CRISPR-associated protein Cse2/CasB [Streptomyces sp. NPDC001407]|uniref:type I-E CRISPR-associated protein Cse2/CasB n=1 Tax=Streptomyces sp. NPDC001407 TaxID=3364573 RepID=UPI0036B3602A